MKIRKITIRGMHNVVQKEYTFDNITYLIGPNGSGKSTVLQAIQLALLGYVPMTGKAKGSVFQHMSGKTMQIILELADGDKSVTITRMFFSNGGKNTSEVMVDPEGTSLDAIVNDLELPIFNFNELLGMTANMQKDWFIKFLPEVEDDQGVELKLMESLNDLHLDPQAEFVISLMQQWHEYRAMTGGVSAALAHFNNYLKSVRQLKLTEQTRVSGTINSLIRYDDESSDEGILEAVKEERRKVRAHRDHVADYLHKKAQYDRVQAELQRFSMNDQLPLEENPDYIAANSALLQVQQKMTDLSDAIIRLRGRRDQYRDQMAPLEALLKSTDGTCPFTKSICDSIKGLLDDARTSHALIQEDYLGVSNRIIDMEKELEGLRKQMMQLGQDLSQIRVNHDNYLHISAMQIEAPVAPEGSTDLAEIDAIITDLEHRIGHITANVQYAKLADTMTKDKFKVDLELEVLKRLIAATGPNGIQSALSVRPFAHLAVDMCNYTSPIFGDKRTPKFIISEKANSFSFGLQNTETNDYVPFSLLSSGEKCVVSTALMMAIINRAKSPLKVLMIDDLFDHLDDQNHDILTAMLASHPEIQYILAGVVGCANDHVTLISI
jgi:DNA repair exonuclease SbcCD ATPase subunit